MNTILDEKATIKITETGFVVRILKGDEAKDPELKTNRELFSDENGKLLSTFKDLKENKESKEFKADHFEGTLGINSPQICLNFIKNDNTYFPYKLIFGYLDFALSNTSDEVNYNNYNEQKLFSNLKYEYRNDIQKLDYFLNPINKLAEKSDFISQIINSEEIFEEKSLSIEEYKICISEMQMYRILGMKCFQTKSEKKRKYYVAASENDLIKRGSQLSMANLYTTCLPKDLKNGEAHNEDFERIGNTDKQLNLIKNNTEELNDKKIMEIQEAIERKEIKMKKNKLVVKKTIEIQINEKNTEIDNKNYNRNDFNNGNWFSIDNLSLTKKEEIKKIDVSSEFTGKLLPYQQQGLDFLYNRYSVGAGACLADDSVYDKFSQVIALIDRVRVSKAGKSLLIVPKSKMDSWKTEIKNLAPSLNYKIVKNSKGKPDFEADVETDIFIISPRMACKTEELVNINWNIVILDEARVIKNPNTIISKFVKVLNANCRIALMTNPIENDLLDIWSLFDFLQKGILGNAKEFSKIFKDYIYIEDNDNLTKLQIIIKPFILRRIKSDGGIKNKVTEIIESKNWINRTSRQESQIEAYLDKGWLSFEDEIGPGSKGISFKILKNLKDICLHPDVFTKQSDFLPEDNEKFARLQEIIEAAASKNEKVIIYTTSRIMINPLVDFLESKTLLKGLKLHGGLSKNKRKEVIDNFNSNININFLISTYAMANEETDLTSAKHVILYDRWWNPATERKAIEAVHKGNQENTVNVYKLITRNTVENLIDKIIDNKILKFDKVIIPTPLPI